MNSNLEWNAIRDFLAIARHHTLAGAARALGVNHSTVFRRLNNLEKRLNVRLFERQPNGYLLTPAGEAMLRHAEAMEAEAAAVEREIAGRDVALRGSLRVTTTEAFADAYLINHLQAFYRSYPDIHIELLTGQQVFDLDRRDADVAIRPGIEPPEHLIAYRLASLNWGVYAAPDYLVVNGAPENPQQLAGHRLVCFPRDWLYEGFFRWQYDMARRGQVVFTSNSLLSQRKAVIGGVGIGILPRYLGDVPALVPLFYLPDEIRLDIWMLTHPDLRGNARVRAFTEFMRESIRREGEGLSQPVPADQPPVIPGPDPSRQ